MPAPLEAEWSQPVPVSYTARDTILYALGVGASDLRLVYEADPRFQALPTMAFSLYFKSNSSEVVPFPPPWMQPSGQWRCAAAASVKPVGHVLDGERALRLLRPLPRCSTSLAIRSRTVGASAKKSGVIVDSEQVLFDPATGEEYVYMTSRAFMVGARLEAGVLGRPFTYGTVSVPRDRGPDKVVTEKVPLNAAALYRLSGDYNPIHIDPDVAKAKGLDQTPLHGLRTLGFALRQVLEAFNRDPMDVVELRGRFTRPVHPGQTLTTEMWLTPEDSVLLRVTYEGHVVLANAYVKLKKITSKL